MNIYDISKTAGVSIATVSRVRNDSPHVSQRTKEKVLGVIEACGYVPNAFARGLGLNSMKTVGLLCYNAADPYIAQALTYLERAFRENGYDCLLGCTGREHEGRQRGVAEMTTRHVDGMVLMGSTFIEETDEGNHYIREAAQKLPLVLLNGAFQCENVYCVLCDDQTASMDATQYLLDTGSRNILYLYHSRNYSGRKKLAGYRAALQNRGVALQENLVQFFSEDKMSVTQVRDHLLAQRQKGLEVAAVFTSEDVLGIGAVKFAQAAGLSIPGDLRIVGYNNSAFCQFCDPELTSVDNKLKAICSQCVTTLLGVLEGSEMPQRTVFTGELIRRGSA